MLDEDGDEDDREDDWDKTSLFVVNEAMMRVMAMSMMRMKTRGKSY